MKMCPWCGVVCVSTGEEVAGGPAPGSCSAGRGHVTAVRRPGAPQLRRGGGQEHT